MQIIQVDSPSKFPSGSCSTFQDDTPEDACARFREHFGIEPETVYYYISPTKKQRTVMIPLPEEWVA